MATPYLYTNVAGTVPYPTADKILANKLFAHQDSDVTSGAYFVNGVVKPWHNIAVSGDNFGGASVTFEWSLDGINNWTALVDAQGNPTTFTAAALKTIVVLRDIWVRARMFNSSGTTSNISAILC